MIFVAVLVVAAVWLFFGAGGAGGPAPTPTFPAPPQAAITPPTLDDLASQYPRLARLLRDPAVDSAYKDFVIAYEQGGVAAAEQLARTRGLLTADNHVRVTLVVDTADTTRLIADLEALGINVLGTYQDLIDISIPLSVIADAAQSDDPVAVFERVRDLEHVTRLELTPRTTPQDQLRAPPLGQPSVDVIVSEGVFTTNADQWHTAGFTGRNVRIGILDQGFDGYRDAEGRELPAGVSIRSFVSGVEPDETGENHGTAVAEIVHDMAPDAALFLAYYDGGDVSMGNAVDWLLEQKVQIISHSAGGLAGPMDGTGRDAELVDRAASLGVLWVNSAGNSADEHLRFQFSDADQDGFEDFNPASSLLAFRPAPERTTQIVLNWNDWPLSDQDYDLYLLDRDGIVLASSRNIQAGNRAPVEQIVYKFDDLATYYVAVQATNTTREAQLDLYIHEARSMEHTTPSHSLATPADARGALSVGAVFYRDDSLQAYSSYGPTNDGRPKPDLLGPDGVSVAAFAPEAFYGTSAAAPHIAGAAALIWSAHPEFSAADIRVSLLANTLPVQNPAGPDAMGAGVLRLPAPPRNTSEVRPTPRATVPAAVSIPAGNPTGAVAAVCAVSAGAVAVVSVLALRRRSPTRGAHPLSHSADATECTVCGAQVAADAQYCGQCGRPLEAAASRMCAECGTRLRPAAAFCPNCGTAV